MSQPTMSRQQALDQRRAKHAWDALTGLARIDNGQRRYDDGADDYAREAKKLPARIVASGLGQAMAFILAKAKKKETLAKLHDDLTNWVIVERKVPGATDPKSLLQSIIRGNSVFLRQATDEVLAYLQWLNRFAEADGLPKKKEE